MTSILKTKHLSKFYHYFTTKWRKSDRPCHDCFSKSVEGRWSCRMLIISRNNQSYECCALDKASHPYINLIAHSWHFDSEIVDSSSFTVIIAVLHGVGFSDKFPTLDECLRCSEWSYSRRQGRTGLCFPRKGHTLQPWLIDTRCVGVRLSSGQQSEAAETVSPRQPRHQHTRIHNSSDTALISCSSFNFNWE